MNRLKYPIRTFLLAILTLGTFVAVSSCRDLPYELVHLESEGVRLPVTFRGNVDADVVVIYNHGGPGSPEFDRIAAAIQALSDDYLIVTWAQRSTIMASGRVTAETNTVAQHGEDLHRVRELVEHRYPGKRVVLVGHSWGVTVIASYLNIYGGESIDGVVLSDGWLDYDSNVHNATFAMEELSNDRQNETWEAHREFARRVRAAGPPYAWEDIMIGTEICFELESSADVDVIVDWGDQRLQPVAAPILIPSGFQFNWQFDSIIQEFPGLDLRPGLRDLGVPTLLLWGSQDCRVPPTTAVEILEVLGDTPATLEIIDGAAHIPFDESPIRSEELLRTFLRGL